MEKTEINARTLSVVAYPREDGQSGVSYVLPAPIRLSDAGLTPLSVCLLCLLQAPVGTLERLILCQIATAESSGSCMASSYADLGRMLGKSAYSVERAVAVLRKAGLVITARVGREHATVSFSCRHFLKWAASVLDPHTEPDLVNEAPAEEQALPTPSPSASVADGGCPAPKEKDDRPEDPMAMAAPYEGEFDASVERADTLRAAGRTGADNDSDVISFGAETADTDMGHGVRMNTNL